jgi:hypothetical protein
MIMDRFAKKVFLITVPFLFIAPVSARDDSRPRYLAPDAFAEAPAKVVAELKARGCMIPQARTGKAHNLIQGEFIAKGQVDWAVLCSREGKSSILLISDNNGKCQEHGTGDDAAYMQQVDRQKVQYSRLIRKQTRNDIAKRLSESGPSSRLAPERVDHDGIGDVYIGKASTTLYCMEGRWVELDGAD